MKANSVNNISAATTIQIKPVSFRSEGAVTCSSNANDEFISQNKSQNKKLWLILGGITFTSLAAFLTHKAGWWGKNKEVKELSNTLAKDFKNINEAKEFFEQLGINTEFRDVTNSHLALLNRIKNDLSKLKEYGVKFDKPDTITFCDWSKKSEYEELLRLRGISMDEYKPDYNAFCKGDNLGRNHIFFNSKKTNTDVFRHEMGHANHHRGHDSYWEAKGITSHDFADKQLEFLGQNIKVYREGHVENHELDNIFRLYLNNDTARSIFPTSDRETRFIYINKMLEAMQKETGCYAPTKLGEQVAYIFDELVKGNKTFSDEVMLYYDFAGGARIPNKLINGMTYDKYIESIYNNSDLLRKLKENVIISKL